MTAIVIDLTLFKARKTYLRSKRLLAAYLELARILRAK